MKKKRQLLSALLNLNLLPYNFQNDYFSLIESSFLDYLLKKIHNTLFRIQTYFPKEEKFSNKTSKIIFS